VKFCCWFREPDKIIEVFFDDVFKFRYLEDMRLTEQCVDS